MFVFPIGTAVNLLLPDPIFLAAHHETLNWGRLPKRTADPGSHDKTILREWARGPASAQLVAGSLHETVGGALGARQLLNKDMAGGR